mgnify:CR=1 FL=1
MRRIGVKINIIDIMHYSKPMRCCNIYGYGLEYNDGLDLLDAGWGYVE